MAWEIPHDCPTYIHIMGCVTVFWITYLYSKVEVLEILISSHAVAIPNQDEAYSKVELLPKA